MSLITEIELTTNKLTLINMTIKLKFDDLNIKNLLRTWQFENLHWMGKFICPS